MKKSSTYKKSGLILLAITMAFISLGSGYGFSARAQASGLAVDGSVKTHQSSASSSITSGAFSTTQTNDLLVAFLTSDGPSQSGGQHFVSVTGGNLTWTLRQRTNVQAGTAEIWQAVAPQALTNTTIKATRSSGSYSGSIDVVAFSGASVTNGATASANASRGVPTISLATTQAGSWVWAVGNDWDNATTRTVGPNQSKFDEYLANATGDTYWAQSQTNTTPVKGTNVTINDTAPSGDRYNLAAIEILPATSTDTTPPSTPTNLTAMAVGATQVNLSWSASTDNIGVSGYIIYRNGVQLATSPSTQFSDTTAVPNTTYSYTVSAYDAANNISPQSTPVTITTGTASAPTIDASSPAVVAIPNNANSATTAAFSPSSNTVLYTAFSIDSYPGASGAHVAGVTNTGSPLVWHFKTNENSNNSTVGGYVEVWWAYNPSAQTNITVTGNFAQATKNVTPPVGMMKVFVVDGAASDQSSAMSATANNVSGPLNNAPAVTVNGVPTNSLVLAVVDTWNSVNNPPALPANQTLEAIVLNTADVDSYWVQGLSAPTISAGPVTMSATLNTNDNWHIAAWAILGQ